MIFSSVQFLLFFIVVVAVVLSMQKFGTRKEIKQAFLLAASYFFYGYWDWRFCFLMLAMAVIAHVSTKRREQKFFRVAGIVFPLAILGVFKYFDFFVGSFCAAFGLARSGMIEIILPVGISFFTFQSMSYTIDVFKGRQETVDFLKLALYIAFFPQLVAGPIVKARDFLPQLDEDRKIRLCNVEKGIQIFVFGLFKKVVLADRLSVFVDEVFRSPDAFDAPTLILAVVSYSFQIYFDFSGYSDMAIGSAKILGYDFQANFNLPYISRNLTEFWKRWHISLSSWLGQYLYIPLGGNRKGKMRTYINLMLTMALGGLWHGANWTFVIWGVLHGLGLCIHKFFAGRVQGSPDSIPKGNALAGFISVIATYIFVCFAWIFFRASDFGTAFTIISGIFTWQGGVSHMFMWSFVAACVVATGTLAALVRADGREITGYYPIFSLNTVRGLFVLLLIVGLICGLAYLGDNPFIYFQF
ncbi:MAG: MBOAT family protein [Clostridiales Family XIII bacterium]|jgi:alginate O-acetyltransferase complex protein AlgI|nr:MBOAT family protein [Clostridiales Family XIII bacterium]